MSADNIDLSSQGTNERLYRKSMKKEIFFKSRCRLATSSRMEDACAALLVGDTGFRTERAGAATAGTVFMLPHPRMPKSGELALGSFFGFVGCRPPMLVRVAPEGGRMLATSARKAGACTALLVGDTGFHTKGTETATASCACMTSAHKWQSLETSLSQPVLPLLGYRPPMLVRVAPGRGAYAAGFSYSRALFQSPIVGARGQGEVRWK